jgi:hypothetical protein
MPRRCADGNELTQENLADVLDVGRSLVRGYETDPAEKLSISHALQSSRPLVRNASQSDGIARSGRIFNECSAFIAIVIWLKEFVYVAFLMDFAGEIANKMRMCLAYMRAPNASAVLIVIF